MRTLLAICSPIPVGCCAKLLSHNRPTRVRFLFSIAKARVTRALAEKMAIPVSEEENRDPKNN